jgi:hypothetical protein
MTRRLLNIASVVCLVLCVALMGMWVRSYYILDALFGFPPGRQFNIQSQPGRVWLNQSLFPFPRPPGPPWSIDSVSRDDFEYIIPAPCQGLLTPMGFGEVCSWTDQTVIVPFWFLVLVSGLLAMAFQLRWPPRFTIRSLFIVTTFLAVVLGMIAWLDRAWIGK